MNRNCKLCHWSGVVDLYHECPDCIPKVEKIIKRKAANQTCRYCWWTWLDWYWGDCSCTYA